VHQGHPDHGVRRTELPRRRDDGRRDLERFSGTSRATIFGPPWPLSTPRRCGPGAHLKRRDAIIDELHRVREDFGKAHDFDVRRITATIRQHEDEDPEGVIRESHKRTVPSKKA
jgi:hypothetical protein